MRARCRLFINLVVTPGVFVIGDQFGLSVVIFNEVAIGLLYQAALVEGNQWNLVPVVCHSDFMFCQSIN